MVELVVARIGRAQGLRGEVALAVRSDNPKLRLRVGVSLDTRPADAGPLVIGRVRENTGRWFVTFEGVDDRTAAEALAGIELVADAAVSDEPDAWYSHELAGLVAELHDGTVLGEVLGLDFSPGQDLLVVRTEDGTKVLVPFVHQIVPAVDIEGGRVVIEPPGGLFPTIGVAEIDDPQDREQGA